MKKVVRANAPTIQKGIPVPTARGDGRYAAIWRDMQVGDSFWVNGHDEGIRGSLYKSAKAKALTVTTRREGDGMRVWVVGDYTEAKKTSVDSGEPGHNSERPLLSVVK